MTAAEAIKDYITALLPGWRIQYGRWTDEPKTDKFAVIRPVGGGMASLTRSPKFTILLIGGLNDSSSIPTIAAETIIQAMRSDNGSLVVMRADEPVYMATDDGRTMLEFSVNTITN